MLIDDGVIIADPDGWRVLPERLMAVQVPPTLTGVLQARLDALPATERDALQQAAIVGHVFWDQALAAIDAAAAELLPALQRRGLIVPRQDLSGGGAGEYAFQHHLLQQVTYETVLSEPRRRGHALVGAFWQSRAQVAGPHQVSPASSRALAEAHEHCRLADPASFAAWFGDQCSHYLNAYAGQLLRPMAQSVVELCERHHGADDVRTARALTNLARVALQRGETDLTGPALRRALAIQERTLEPDHPDLARTFAVLGGWHQGRGEHSASEPYFRRALEIRERILGPEHETTINTLDLLAHTVTEIGRLDEAELLARRVLSVRERERGPDSPDTASAMTALAEVQAKQGELAQAEQLLRRALAVQQSGLSSGHPDIGLTMWHLSETLRALGRLEEAEPLARQTLELFEQAFGESHEWTAWGLGSLAEVCLAQGDFAEAEALALRAQAIFERHFGPQHAQVAAMQVVQARAALAQTAARGEFPRQA
jgi:tetratricopeptide (TPR) repeat protein